MTVPKRPMNGALLPRVPRYARRLLQLHALEGGGAGHRFFRGLRAVRGLRQAGEDDGGLRRWGGFHALSRGVDRLAQGAAEIALEDEEVVAQRPEEPTALEDDRDADHAQAQHEPHDPRRAEADHDALKPLDEVHLGSCAFRSGAVRSPLAGDGTSVRSFLCRGGRSPCERVSLTRRDPAGAAALFAAWPPARLAVSIVLGHESRIVLAQSFSVGRMFPVRTRNGCVL